jgi:hypothetical protein
LPRRIGVLRFRSTLSLLFFSRKGGDVLTRRRAYIGPT